MTLLGGGQSRSAALRIQPRLHPHGFPLLFSPSGGSPRTTLQSQLPSQLNQESILAKCHPTFTSLPWAVTCSRALLCVSQIR